jgi:hypothetical protein
VLLELVRNPDFSPRAKACILRHLDFFTFDSSKEHLLREMEGRGEPRPLEEPAG